MYINPDDLIIVYFSQNGMLNIDPIGVSIEHKPTGVSIKISDFRTQHENKQKAMSIISEVINSLCAYCHKPLSPDETHVHEQCDKDNQNAS